jgi:hypothetical protein
LTTETSITPIRFDLPDLPGPVAALRLAMAQADARQNAHSFIDNMLRVLRKAAVDNEIRDELHDLAEAMLLDEAMQPYAIFSGARSCLSRELVCPGGDDAAAINEIYGDGFAAALCASVPAGYPRVAGTARGGGMPASYPVPCGEWADALNSGAFGDTQSQRPHSSTSGGCGESR